MMVEVQLGLARQIEHQKNIICLYLLQFQTLHCFVASQNGRRWISFADALFDLIVEPLNVLFEQFSHIDQRPIWSTCIILYPSSYSSITSYRVTREHMSIYPPSFAQSKFILIADPYPNTQQCSSFSLPASVVFPDPLGPIINTAFIGDQYYQWCYITNIIQMQILESCILRKENASLKLKYAFSMLKLNYLTYKARNVSFRDEFVTHKTMGNNPSTHTIELQNKQLYLRYVQEVLTSKQQDLIQLQQHLNLRRAKLDQQEGQAKISNPAALNHYADLINKKIIFLKQTAINLSNSKNTATILKELEQFRNGLKMVEESCRLNHEKYSADFLNEFHQLNVERRQISAMKGKLHELQSYQKYLNQLQTVLQQKEYQIIIKQRELQQLSHAFYQSNSQTLSLKNAEFNTYKQADQSIRKRARIFEPRTSSQELLAPHNHKQSSKIMGETSANDYVKQTQKTSKEHEHVEIQPQGKQIIVTSTANCSSQTTFDNEVGQAFSRILCQKIKIKFIKLWAKYSERAGKGGQAHLKCMNFYLWRLNTVYEEEAKQKIQRAICWPMKMEKLGDIPKFTYKQLSLKKRKYVEMFFNYERKRFQRTKILTHLHSILKNKNRKQRTAVYIYFQKMKNNSKLIGLLNIFQPSSTQSVIIEKPSNITYQKKPKSDSRVLGNSASENRVILSQNSRNKLASSKVAPSATTNSKTRLVSKQAAIDIPRLKQYIKNQEETEVKLATECAQTEAAFKIHNVLAFSLYKLRTRFIVNSLRIIETSKLNSLEKSISSCEFKWELFMAKARLALTNNSNKIAHLEQLTGFMECK